MTFDFTVPVRTFKITGGPGEAFQAYPHQQAAWDALDRFRSDGLPAGLLVVPTGGGKTYLAAVWLLRNILAKGGKVLWLAHRRSLLQQAFECFAKNVNHAAAGKDELQVVRISSTDSTWSRVEQSTDVVIASTQTTTREDNEGFLERFKNSGNGLFVVLDEAHHAPAPSIARLLTKLRSWGCPLIGLTATPVRTDEEDARRLSNLFGGRVLYQVSRFALTQQQILAEAALETVMTSINFEREFTAADFQHLETYGDLGPDVLRRLAAHAPRNKLIVDRYRSNAAKYGPTVVFAANVLHARTLAEEFQRAGIQADYVDYEREDSALVIERYRTDRKPDVLVNVEMLTEGFDAPHTRTVFIARPTKSQALLQQMVGRALRGRKAGGNDRAYLVTFLDTWSQFDVLDTHYVLEDPQDVGVLGTPGAAQAPKPAVVIPPELIREVYRILQSNVRGELQGVSQCIPHGWYVWEQEFEDDQQRRTVMVYDHQRSAFEELRTCARSPELPAEILEDLALALRRRFFGDLQDPLPRTGDIQALIDAERKGCDVRYYTFEEKAAFDPYRVAKELHQSNPNIGLRDVDDRVHAIWTSQPACSMVYRNDERTYREEVHAALRALTEPPAAPPPPEVVDRVPQAPAPWPAGAFGYSLIELRDAVLTIKEHFPRGAPTVQDLGWTKRALRRCFGFYRSEDRAILINVALDSPSIPRFALEFLLYHELLHADMPHAGHNADFRQRERKFRPSADAVKDATDRGFRPGTTPDAWRVLADQFFDTFCNRYLLERPALASPM